MDGDEIEAAATHAGLEKLFAQFTDEVATAIELARAQAAAMRDVPLNPDDAP